MDSYSAGVGRFDRCVGLLHRVDRLDRPERELEAESTAYVVCQALGLDSSEYTFGYVVTWTGGGDEAIALIEASGQRIQRAAAEILNLLGEDSASGDSATAVAA